MPATVVIPARFASTRFPGKPLASLLGKPMVQHVYERAVRATLATEVFVATDDHRIAQAVHEFGGRVIFTSSDHLSGTSRVFEAAETVKSDTIINLQADEPLINSEQIDQVIRSLKENHDADIATLRVPSHDAKEILSPHCVKVVVDHRQFALYFSRAAIPFYRDFYPASDSANQMPENWGQAWIHIGLYGFRKPILKRISNMPPSLWEEVEKLEQLRFLYWGCRIFVAETSHRTFGVDLPEDLDRVERALVQEIPNHHARGVRAK